MTSTKEQIKYRKLTDLHKLEGNPRTITGSDFDRLCESLKDNPDYFEARPLILSDRTGELVILAGNQRYEAAKTIGLEEVPTFLIHGLTEEREKEIIIRDNVNNGQWDMDILANEWDQEQLADWGVTVDWEVPEKEVVEVETPEPAEESSTKRGDLFICGNHRVLCGDSTKMEDVAKLMDGAKADLLLTDPPYNVDYGGKAKMLNQTYGGDSRNETKIKNDNWADEEAYKAFLTDALKVGYKNMTDEASFNVWYASAHVVANMQALEAAGFDVKQEVIWNKNALVLGRQDWQWKHEPSLVGWKQGQHHNWYGNRKQTTVIEDVMDLDKMTKEEMRKVLEQIQDGSIPTTVINENKPSANDLHPTMKPVRLFGKIMQNYTKDGDKVLDLFGESGTTMMAAEQLDRAAYICELDPKFVDVIVKRWENFTGEKAEKVSA